MHVYTFSFTASGWTSLLYPEMLFVWKAESQGEIHFHYTDNQRADQHQNNWEDLSTLYRKHFFPPVLSSVLICNPSACCVLQIRPPLTVFSKHNTCRVPPATLHSNHTLRKDGWKSTTAMWSTVKFMALNFKESLPASDYFYTNYGKKWRLFIQMKLSQFSLHGK